MLRVSRYLSRKEIYNEVAEITQDRDAESIEGFRELYGSN